MKHFSILAEPSTRVCAYVLYWPRSKHFFFFPLPTPSCLLFGEMWKVIWSVTDSTISSCFFLRSLNQVLKNTSTYSVRWQSADALSPVGLDSWPTEPSQIWSALLTLKPDFYNMSSSSTFFVFSPCVSCLTFEARVGQPFDQWPTMGSKM